MIDFCSAVDRSTASRQEVRTLPAVSTMKIQNTGAFRSDPSRARLATVVAKRIGALLLVALVYVPLMYRQEIFLSIGDRFGRYSAGASGIQGRRLAAYGDAGNGHRTQGRELMELKVAGRALQSFPSMENSTILFLHVFKCAGTSLREVLLNWAKSEGWTGAVVHECMGSKENEDKSNNERICLNSKNDLIDKRRVKWLIQGQKVLAGHFLWDFRQYVTQPYLMITTLRDPLELVISAQQFKHRVETQTVEAAAQFVSDSMQGRLRWADRLEVGFIRRFLDRSVADEFRSKNFYSLEEYNGMVTTAVDHLSTFWVVGVVEQYDGFLEVLKHLLDPYSKNPALWEASRRVKDNGSPVASSNVLARIEPSLLAEFNSTVLGLEWQVYDAALELWGSRCRELLPVLSHDSLCAIPARS